MHAGLTRNQALRPLTELASGQSADIATNAPIVDLGDLRRRSAGRVHDQAHASSRSASPAYVSAPAAVPGMVELFDADLADETLDAGDGRLRRRRQRTPPRAAADRRRPLSDRRRRRAVALVLERRRASSRSPRRPTNLVYGDGNTPPLGHESQLFDGSDAFVVSRVLFGSSAAQGYISPPPAPPVLSPSWRLGATASSRRDGSVLLRVLVPAAGSLRVAARGRTVVRARSSSRRRRGKARASVVTQTVASRSVVPRSAGLVSVELRLAARYAALANQRGGLSASVNLVFTLRWPRAAA